jgi:L-histidine Nalpha-methyltransferase
MAVDVQDPARAAFLRDVVAGLSAEQRAIPCKYFYDARGSALFDRITTLEAYYPTRTELSILRVHGRDIARAIGDDVVLIELGSGSSVKTRLLLDQLPRLAAYVPIDISEEHLHMTSDELRAAYPELSVLPVAADYTNGLSLPELPEHSRRVAFFPGSTIGNFEQAAAEHFLRMTARLVGPAGGLVIGVDLDKDAAILERAYDDEEGVTAAFNRNLLHRINDELDGDIDPTTFEHRAVWNESASRVEMYLVSRKDQEIAVNGHRFALRAGDAIHTENSHKYTLDSFSRLAAAAGFRTDNVWLDDEGLFSVHYLVAVDHLSRSA